MSKTKKHPSSKKAGMMMKEGMKGHMMTQKQMGLMGMLAGAMKPTKTRKAGRGR